VAVLPLAFRNKSHTLNLANFTWDSRKAAGNARKHGITLEEAATVFADPLALAVQDEAHAEVDEDTLRLVSARRETSHERRRYEEGQ
jgi:uncharacterized DUF497 family protein